MGRRRRTLNSAKRRVTTPAPAGLYLEAEAYDAAGARWSEETDFSPSGGSYMRHDGSIQKDNTAPDEVSPDPVRLLIYSPTLAAGTYKLWVRAKLKLNSTSFDSFYVRLGDGSWNEVNNLASILGTASFTWRQVHIGSDTGAYYSIAHAGGAVVLQIASREGVDIDRIYITEGDETPA